MIAKAVILARGLGTRMRRDDGAAAQSADQAKVADTGLKAMIPVGRPFIDYVLSAVADAGVERACLVIGPDHRAVRDHYVRQRPSRLAVEFAIQATARGTADAVAAARPFTGDELFLVLNGDNYYPVPALASLRALDAPGLAAFSCEDLTREGIIEPARIRLFAFVAAGPVGVLSHIVEKPDDAALAAFARPWLVSMNCWAFDASIFEACRRIEPSSRGELELTSAVSYAIRHLGTRFRVVRAAGPVLDLSTRADIAAAAEYLAGIEVRL